MKEDTGDFGEESEAPETPLDLVMQSHYSVENAKLVMDLLIGKYGYDPREKVQMPDGSYGRPFEECVFSIILCKDMDKDYFHISSKLDRLFELTSSFSLESIMGPFEHLERKIVAKAIVWDERKEQEQWHPSECACKRCESHSNMLAGKSYDKSDIHGYDHPNVWSKYENF